MASGEFSWRNIEDLNLRPENICCNEKKTLNIKKISRLKHGIKSKLYIEENVSNEKMKEM